MPKTWREYDTHIVQAGTTRNDYFHATDQCPRINDAKKSTDRSESFVAFHEPAPCEYCHPGARDAESDDSDCGIHGCPETPRHDESFCPGHTHRGERQLATDGGADTVIVSSAAGHRGNTTYHRDESCGYVKRMDDTIEKALSVIESHYEPCSRCAVATDGGTPRYKIAERVAVRAAETVAKELSRQAADRLDEDARDELVHAIEYSVEESVNSRLKMAAAKKYDHDIATDGGLPETHVDGDGLRIPPELREFDQQIIIRTPRATIQHFGTDALDPYYGMVDETHFGDPDQMRDAQNPNLAPDRISIKPQGEDAVEFVVNIEKEFATDGGQPNDVVYEQTERDVEGLSKAALVAEWSEIQESLQVGSWDEEDRAEAVDRSLRLWAEMRSRTDAEPPECPECGHSGWSQRLGGPKYCTGCDLMLAERHRETIEAVDQYWSKVRSLPDNQREALTDGGLRPEDGVEEWPGDRVEIQIDGHCFVRTETEAEALVREILAACEDDEEIVTDGGQPDHEGVEMYWDGDDCPRVQCDGDLVHADEFNVSCRTCQEAWSHVKDSDEHMLVSAAGKIIKRRDRDEDQPDGDAA